MICNHCGAELTDGSTFCTQCGSPVSLDDQTGKTERILVADVPDEAPYGSDGLDVIACPACGERNAVDDVVCYNCGAPLERDSYYTNQATQAMPAVAPIASSPRHATEPADRPNRGTGRMSRHTAERQARIAAGEPPYRGVEPQPSLSVYPEEEERKPLRVIIVALLIIIAIVAAIIAIAQPFGSSDSNANNANVTNININENTVNTANNNVNANSNVNAAAINNAANTNAAASNTNAAAANTNTNTNAAASDTNTSASLASTQESASSSSSSSANSGSSSSSSSSSSSNSGSVKVSLRAANGKTLSGTVHQDASGYVLADSSTHKYSMSELRSLGLSPAEMCIAWNEPYARAGYHFSNAGLRAYFNSTDWYVDSGSKPELTGTPVENAKAIRELAENSGASEWKYLALY